MDKYYGIFNVCVDRRDGKNALQNKKVDLYARLIEEMKKEKPDSWSIRAATVYESRACQAITNTLYQQRMLEAYDDKFRRTHRFKMKYFIHETDEKGWLKLSKKEQAAAEALLKRREEAEKKAKEEAKN